MDIELMSRVRDMIILHPEQHDQSGWVRNAHFDGGRVSTWLEDCGTRACVAGWAVLLSAPSTSWLYDNGEFIKSSYEPGCVIYVSDYAQKLLGLEDDQAAWLFAPFRSQNEVIKALDYLPDHPDADWYELRDMCDKSG